MEIRECGMLGIRIASRMTKENAHDRLKRMPQIPQCGGVPSPAPNTGRGSSADRKPALGRTRSENPSIPGLPPQGASHRAARTKGHDRDRACAETGQTLDL